MYEIPTESAQRTGYYRDENLDVRKIANLVRLWLFCICPSVSIEIEKANNQSLTPTPEARKRSLPQWRILVLYIRFLDNRVLEDVEHMLSDTTLLLTVSFLAAAILYSSVGHAGASGYLAAMAFVGIAPSVMKPTALVLNLLVASIATIRFARAGFFSWSLLWPFAAGSIPLAFVGGAVTLPGHWYKGLVGMILVLSAIQLALQNQIRASAESQYTTAPTSLAILSGAIIGFLSGITGTGGGIFLSPLLIFTRWAETRETGGVSAAFILVNSAAGLAGNLASMQFLPPAIPLWAFIVTAGGLIGTELGTRRIGTRTFRQLLAVVLVIAGGKLILGA